MALFITFGTSLTQKVGMVEVVRSFAGVKGRCGLLWLSIFGLPTAVFFSPMLMSVIALAGIDSQRLSSKLLCLLISLAVVTYLEKKLREISELLVCLLVFPLMEGNVWLVLPMLEWVHSFWPTGGFGIYAYFVLENFHRDNSILYFVKGYRRRHWKDRGLLRVGNLLF